MEKNLTKNTHRHTLIYIYIYLYHFAVHMKHNIVNQLYFNKIF